MKTSALIAASALFVLPVGDAQARDRYALEHVDELAVTLERQAESLARHLEGSFRHTHYYRHLRDDAKQLAREAHHIHELAHHARGTSYELRHIRRDVAEIDSLMHHMQELTADALRGLSHHHHRSHYYGSPYGGIRVRFGHGVRLSYGGYGHHSGYDYHKRRALETLQYQLSAIERTVHHLQEDLERL